MDNQQHEDLERVAEFVATGYWLDKVGKNDLDPINSRNRVGGSAYVRSNADYAATAAGQISAGHFLLMPIFKLLLAPFAAIMFFVCVFLPVYVVDGLYPAHLDPVTLDMVHKAPTGIDLLVAFIGFLFWAYVIAWRLCLKPILKLLSKHAPNVTFADGYRGPLGGSETVITRSQHQTRERVQPLEQLPHSTER